VQRGRLDVSGEMPTPPSNRHGDPTRRRLRSMRHLRVTAISAVMMMGAMHGAAAGQQPAEPLFRSLSNDLVVLAAAVSDGDGGRVQGLDRQWFKVYDNGKPQVVQFFSNEDVPVSVGLIIDSSGSMRGRTGDVIAAAVAFAQLSHPRDQLFALAFNDSIHELLRDRRFLLASDVASLRDAVASIHPQGQTALYDAIITGLDRLAESSRTRKVLVVMSDGGDNASRATLEQVIDRARRSDASIYTIGLFDATDPDRNPGVLARLSETTGGERFLPASTSRLLEACQRIAGEIRSAYTIAFEPAQRDGKYHRVRVEVDPAPRRGLRVRTRPGYVAPLDSGP
jgi:Ca-activated chloride channel homolog